MYKASQVLIDILLSAGFKEVTPSTEPAQWKLLQERGEYDPDDIKRDLRFGKLTIFFRYSAIELAYNDRCPYKVASELSEMELKSIIVFTKLSSSDRAFLKSHKVYPTKIADYIGKYKQSDLCFLQPKSKAKIEYLQDILKRITIQ